MWTLLVLPIVFFLSRLNLSTSQLRREYGPACEDKGNRYAAAFTALDVCLKKWVYAPRAKDTGAYSCRPITGGTGFSLHAYGPGDYFTFWNGLRIRMSLAVDINWQSNPYGKQLITDMPIGMILDIERIRTNSGAVLFRWGGRYSTNKDAMHFEIVCSAADLRSGINWSTVPGITPAAPSWVTVNEGDTNAKVYARGGPDNAVYEIQMHLQFQGYDLGRSGIDGHYGPASAKAIRKFKRDQIALGGDPKVWTNNAIVGPVTINALRWWSKQQQS